MRFLFILLLAVGYLQRTVHAQEPMTLLPDQIEERRRALLESAPLSCDSFVFAGTDFPQFDFQHPALVKEAVGDYTLQTTVYERKRLFTIRGERET